VARIIASHRIASHRIASLAWSSFFQLTGIGCRAPEPMQRPIAFITDTSATTTGVLIGAPMHRRRRRQSRSRSPAESGGFAGNQGVGATSWQVGPTWGPFTRQQRYSPRNRLVDGFRRSAGPAVTLTGYFRGVA
jgi:hypothetical protein